MKLPPQVCVKKKKFKFKKKKEKVTSSKRAVHLIPSKLRLVGGRAICHLEVACSNKDYIKCDNCPFIMLQVNIKARGNCCI